MQNFPGVVTNTRIPNRIWGKPKLLANTFIVSDHWYIYDMNDHPKNNILVSKNIRQKRLIILEYFDAYICHMHRNIPEVLVLFVWYFPTLRCCFSDFRSYYMCYNCQEEMAIGTDRLDILMKVFEDYIFILYLSKLDFA